MSKKTFPKKRGPGQPPLPPERKRVRMATTVAPATKAFFEREAGALGVGRYLDRIEESMRA